MVDNRVERLVNSIGKLRDFDNNQNDLKEVKANLNLIFGSDVTCNNLIYTFNTDKLPFGCIVFPKFGRGQSKLITNFFIAAEPVQFKQYDVEIDSKMFDYGLTDEEVASVILYNIYHMVKDFGPCNSVRAHIDEYITMLGKPISIRDSVQYDAILDLGCMDALNQVSSCVYLPNDVLSDPFLESLGLNNFKSAIDKIYQKFPDCENEVTRLPKLSMLDWCLRLYDNVDTERAAAIRLLDKAKAITGSQLYINKFNTVINALNRIDTELFVNEAVDETLKSLKTNGLFESMDYSALEEIESDLVVYRTKVKNNEMTEADVVYDLAQVNTRLAILHNYIENNPFDEEIDRWENVRLEYMDIRELLAKKLKK